MSTDEYTIYVIINLANYRRYVGVTKRFKYRIGNHLAALRHNNHSNKSLQKDFAQYGESAFVFEIIEEGLMCEEAIRCEQYWIDYFQCVKRGYNTHAYAAGISRATKPPVKDKTKWMNMFIPQYLKMHLREIAVRDNFIPEWRTKERSNMDVGVSQLIKLMIERWEDRGY